MFDCRGSYDKDVPDVIGSTNPSNIQNHSREAKLPVVVIRAHKYQQDYTSNCQDPADKEQSTSPY